MSLKDWDIVKYNRNNQFKTKLIHYCGSGIGVVKVNKFWICEGCLKKAPLEISYIADLCKCEPLKLWHDHVEEKLEIFKHEPSV